MPKSPNALISSKCTPGYFESDVAACFDVTHNILHFSDHVSSSRVRKQVCFTLRNKQHRVQHRSVSLDFGGKSSTYPNSAPATWQTYASRKISLNI